MRKEVRDAAECCMRTRDPVSPAAAAFGQLKAKLQRKRGYCFGIKLLLWTKI